MNKTISIKDLNSFIDSIIASGVETYGVQEKNSGKFHFDKLEGSANLRLDYDVTLTPPKKYFTPEREVFLRYKLKPEVSTNALFETNRRVLIGVHPYDMNAINQMDEVFKEKNEDSHYFKRRNNTIIIGVDPQSATSWSFWHLVDGCKMNGGFDLWLTKLDADKYFLEIATPAGEELVSKHAKVEDATESDMNKRDHVRANLSSICSAERKLNARAGEIPLLVKDKTNHPVWKEKSEKCYSCGSCNIVCPTCYCFDVKDDIAIDLAGGKKERVWDGCQLENFAMVAHGENFRGSRVDRYKHRFYRKTVYQYEKYNHLACVGCGRCSSVCLPNIADPVDIINRLKEE